MQWEQLSFNQVSFPPMLAGVLRCSLIANLLECLSSASLGSMCYITTSLFLPTDAHLLHKEMSCKARLTLHHHGFRPALPGLLDRMQIRFIAVLKVSV